MKFVSIVVPCRNEVSYIKGCIESVARQDYSASHLELLIVDGMSDDGTRELVELLCESHSFVQLIDNPKRFTPIAMNIGIQQAKGEIIVILGAHAALADDFVSKSIETLAQFPDAGCVGGMIENIHENRVAEIVSRAMKSPFGVGNARFRTGGKAGFVDTVAFGAYRKEVFDQCGFFDEELVRNQDDEYNFRLIKGGFKIYFNPDIRSKYFVRGDFKKLFRQYFQYGYWKVYVNKKHRAVTSLRQLVPFFFVLWLIISLPIAIFNAALAPVFTLPLLLWFLAAFGAALHAGCPSKDIPALIRTFFTLHLAYGLGYLRGVIDFLVFNRKPRSGGYTLTR